MQERRSGKKRGRTLKRTNLRKTGKLVIGRKMEEEEEENEEEEEEEKEEDGGQEEGEEEEREEEEEEEEGVEQEEGEEDEEEEEDEMKEEEEIERRKRQMRKGAKKDWVQKKKCEKAKHLKGLNYNPSYDMYVLVYLKMCHKNFVCAYFVNTYNALVNKYGVSVRILHWRGLSL